MFGTPSIPESLLRHRREAITDHVAKISSDKRAAAYYILKEVLVDSNANLSRENFRKALQVFNDEGETALKAFVAAHDDSGKGDVVPNEQAQKAVTKMMLKGMKKLNKDDLLAIGIDDEVKKFLAARLKKEIDSAIKSTQPSDENVGEK